jgi:hypothetical protein
MSRDEFCAANRRNWDERVAIHRRDATGFYALRVNCATDLEKSGFALDSRLEGTGFEPSVPLPALRGVHGCKAAR